MKITYVSPGDNRNTAGDHPVRFPSPGNKSKNVLRYGPIVMNTQEELQPPEEYQNGTFIKDS
jgi:redox-sensitive bicupin YhaK (pirin superfamily)